jgi:acyl-CoA thioesterase I
MRICFFGDSFVNGTGDDDCLGWVGRLCGAERRAGFDLTVYNLGIRRDTSADVEARWRREAELRLSPAEAGRLVFSFGLNDCSLNASGAGPRVARAETLRNARTILSCARSWLPTLMIGPLPVTDSRDLNDRIVELSAELADLCLGLGVPFLCTVGFAERVYADWRAEAALGDGIHPNSQSYFATAQHICSTEVWREWLETEGRVL